MSENKIRYSVLKPNGSKTAMVFNPTQPSYYDSDDYDYEKEKTDLFETYCFNHEPVDTGMIRTWCKHPHCNIDMIFDKDLQKYIINPRPKEGPDNKKGS